MFKLRKPRLRLSKRGLRVSNIGARIGTKNAHINVSRSGTSATAKAGKISANTKRGCSLPFMVFALLIAGAMLFASILTGAPASAATIATSIATPTLGASTPVASVTPTFKGKAPNIKVAPAYWPCEEGQVKGNLNSMIYHTPKMKYYAVTWKNVQCFATAEEAKAAGFKPAKV